MPVLAQFNVSTLEWSVAVNEPEAFSTTLEIGFIGDSSPVVFEGLSFGFTSEIDGEEGPSASYPEDGIEYVSTDQEYISADMIEAEPDATVTVNVWVENAGQRYEDSFSYVVPKPASPFASWVWSEEALGWVPPIPKPEEESPTGNGYMWDEETVSWVPRPEDS